MLSRRWRRVFWGLLLFSLQEDAGMPWFVPGPRISQDCLRGHKAASPVCLSSVRLFQDIITGFRAHWLIQDHILLLPSLTTVSQSPFIKIRSHSCVLDVRRGCLLSAEVGGRWGREVRGTFWSLFQRPCAFLLDFIPSHITFFLYLVTAGIEEWCQLFI